MGVSMSYSLYRLIDLIFNLLYLLIIIRVVLSWIRPNPYAPGVQLIYNLTEPLLAPFRGFFSPGGMGLDLSPLIALLILQLVRRLLISFLF